MPVTVILTRAQVQAIVDHAHEGRPNEVCGVLAGNDHRVERVYRATNVLKSRFRYEIDSLELLKIHRDFEDRDLELVGFYHSHTHSEAYPSATDIDLSAPWRDQTFGIVTFFIVSLKYVPPQFRAFRFDAAGAVSEVPIAIVESAVDSESLARHFSSDVIGQLDSGFLAFKEHGSSPDPIPGSDASAGYPAEVDDFGPTVDLPREPVTGD